MRIKLDENLPAGLTRDLTAIGHDVRTAQEEGMTGSTDLEIWEAVQREARLLITRDLDFSDARRFAPGTHHGILLVRLVLPDRRSLTERVMEIFAKENVAAWAGCFVVATERKVRVRRPTRE